MWGVTHPKVYPRISRTRTKFFNLTGDKKWRLGDQLRLTIFRYVFFATHSIKFRTLVIFDQNFDFWPKFRFLTKIPIFTKIAIFDLNFDFERNFDYWPKFRSLTKISIFDQNFDFLTKISLLTKISIFDQNFDFWPKFRFFDQNFAFDQNFDFWPKFRFLNFLFQLYRIGINYFIVFMVVCPIWYGQSQLMSWKCAFQIFLLHAYRKCLFILIRFQNCSDRFNFQLRKHS